MSERGVDPGAHSEELAIQAARVAEQMKASDIIVLDVGEVLSIAGYFVIASASNQRLVRAVAEEVESQLKVSFDRPPVRVEGLREREWTLIDYGDVVVHVFYEPTREFYEIERLYMDAPSVEWAPTEVTVDES